MRVLALLLVCLACAPSGRHARFPALVDEEREGTLSAHISRDFETGVVVHRWTTRQVNGRAVKDGREQHFWPDGSQRAERFHATGAPRGRWRTWHPGGALRSDYTYADEPHEMLFFHADGTPEARGMATRGVRGGAWTWWYPDGSVKQEGGYLDGAKDGLFTLRHPGGALRSRGRYRDDARVGEWKHWPATPPTPESDWAPPTH